MFINFFYGTSSNYLGCPMQEHPWVVGNLASPKTFPFNFSVYYSFEQFSCCFSLQLIQWARFLMQSLWHGLGILEIPCLALHSVLMLPYEVILRLVRSYIDFPVLTIRVVSYGLQQRTTTYNVRWRIVLCCNSFRQPSFTFTHQNVFI